MTRVCAVRGSTMIVEDNTKVNEASKENFVRGDTVYILGPFDRSIS